jgi:hypothetical protein
MENDKIRWIAKYENSLWYKILFGVEALNLDNNFILHKREGEKPYKDYVNERLISAAQSMKSLPGEMIGINQLLHTASSIILIEGERERIDKTIENIKNINHFKHIDPTVVLTSISLYFLIVNTEHNPKDCECIDDIYHIHDRLDQMNWFISDCGVKALGFEKRQNNI